MAGQDRGTADYDVTGALYDYMDRKGFMGPLLSKGFDQLCNYT